MRCSRLPCSCHDFSPLVATLPTTSQLFQRLLTSCQLFSTSFISVRIYLTLLNSPFISLFSSQILSTRVASPHLSSTCSIFLSPVEVTQTFFFSPVELPFHPTDPFDSLKLRSAYFKIPLPSGQLSVFDCLISFCDTITVSTFACLIILGSCATVTRESNVQARLSRSNFFDAREAV